MKNDRQNQLLQIISEEIIETQEQLLERLQAKGIKSTQATISRDIKELRLIKIASSNGGYKYSIAESEQDSGFVPRVRNIFRECVIKVDVAQNLVVIKTMPGLANGAAAAIDKLNIPEMLGTLAGDDTCFVVLKDTQSAASLCAEIREQIVH